jgi:hypothetical protein
MINNLRIFLSAFFAMSAICFSLGACTSATDTDAQNPSGFQPPSASFFKINGVNSTISGDHTNVSEGSVRVTKAFDFGGGDIHVASLIMNHAIGYKYRTDTMANGTSIAMYLSSRVPDSKDSAMLSITMDYYPSGVYELIANGGKVWMSKVRDTVQITTDGMITLTGKNNFAPNDSKTITSEFNLQNQVSF